MTTTIDGRTGSSQHIMRTKRCYTVDEVSEETTLSKATIRNMIKDGRLEVKRLGRRVVVLSEELDRFLSKD